MEDVTREVSLDANPGEVWQAITSPERLADWFGAQADGELREGELVRFSWPDGSERRAMVERVRPCEELSFRWLPEEGEPSSRVRFEIIRATDGCILRVVETRVEAAVTPAHEIGFLARV